jgi:hypothetical protein
MPGATPAHRPLLALPNATKPNRLRLLLMRWAIMFAPKSAVKEKGN